MKKKVWDHTLGLLFPEAFKILLKMELTLSIILLSIFGAIASESYSQSKKLSLDLKNETVENVLETIESKSDFYFLYSAEQINVDRKVDINVKECSIVQIMVQLFAGTNIDYNIKGRQIVLSSEIVTNTTQQPKSISGRVTDSSGAPLPGVTVIIKGSTSGTITDPNGRFNLSNVSADAILQFTFIGLKMREIVVSEKTTINVTMLEENIGIDEVVAIGYGIQKKATVTGSITTISGEKLMETPVVNMSNAIAGQLPGVIVNTRSGEPGDDDATIFIRGKGTLGSTDALIVIDGVPDRGGFSRLNPEDIESFAVLKDASAAIYGARAANGVILITTKRGKIGKPEFSFNNSVGWSQPTRLPDLLESWQFATVENEYADNFSGAAHKWSDQDIQKFKDGSSPLTHPNTDWLNTILKDWTMQSNHIMSVRGGSDAIRYFISGQYLYQNGGFVYGNFPYNQIQWRANLDAQLTKSFSIGFDMAYRKENRNTPAAGSASGVMDVIKQTYPYLVAYYPNGYPGKGRQSAQPNLGQMTSSKSGYNRKIDDITNTKVSFKWVFPIKGLALTGYGAYDSKFYNQKQLRDIWDEYVYNETAQSYDLIPLGMERSLSITKDNWSTTTFHTQLEYKNSFGKHNVDAFIAYEQSEFQKSHLYAYRQGFVSSEVDQLFAGADDINKTNDGSEETSGRINYFGRINYDFAGKYLASLTLRYDGSQNFPKGNRFGAFPGISVGWRLSEEAFVKDNLPFVNNLKLRSSWGLLGNDNVAPYQYLASYQFASHGGQVGYVFGDDLTYVKGFVESTAPNSNITWEKATTMNLAMEGSLFNNKFDFVVDLFRSNRKDILIARNQSVPDYTGLVLPDENLGKVLNRGIEVQLTYRNCFSEDLSYNVSGNFSFARNKVVYLDEAIDTPDYQKKEGFPIDSYTLYESDGLFQTQAEVDSYPHINGTGPGDVKLLDINDDKVIDSNDKVRKDFGMTPEIMYGINLGVKYKGFDLSTLFQGQANAYLFIRPSLNFQKEFFDGRWKKEGDNLYPRIFQDLNSGGGPSNYGSTYWLRSAAFLRLKNVCLSYDLPKHWVKSIHLSDVKLFVMGSNLFTIDKIKFFDPESDSSSGLGKYPLQRTFQIGLNLNF